MDGWSGPVSYLYHYEYKEFLQLLRAHFGHVTVVGSGVWVPLHWRLRRSARVNGLIVNAAESLVTQFPRLAEYGHMLVGCCRDGTGALSSEDNHPA